MLSAQLLLAHHYIVHFNEDAHIGITQQQAGDNGAPAPDKDHDKFGHDKICQICVFSKSLAQILLSSFAAALIVVCLISGVFFASGQFSRQKSSLVYSARGPPAFLS